MKSKIIVIIGRRGEGKTTLAYSILKNNRKDFEKVIIFDTFQDPVFSSESENNKICVKSEYLELFCSQNLELKKSIILVDEIGLYKDSAGENFEMFMRKSRINENMIIFTGHRAFDLCILVRALATDFMVFKTKEIYDLQYIKRYVNSEMVEKIPKLEKYQFLHYDIEKDVIKIRKNT